MVIYIYIASDKIAAQSRKYIKRYDLENILFEFSRKQALLNINKIKPHTSIKDFNLITRWLKTGNKSIRSAAESAASAAARSATTKQQEKDLIKMIEDKFGRIEGYE